MYILGINAYHADASAAIFKDGILIAATEEERFRRVKHWAGFPSEAVQFCLREAGIELAEIDHIAIGRNPKAKFWKKIAFMLRYPAAGWSAVWIRMDNARQVMHLNQAFAALDARLNPSVIRRKIHNIEHHRSHLASAFFASPYEEAALLSIDGSGDFTTTMRGIGRDRNIEIIDSVDFPHSIGIFYSAFTQLLGFPNYGDEYKVMGLAPYGFPTRVEELRKVLRFESDGLFSLDLSYFLTTKSKVIRYSPDHTPTVSTLFSVKMTQVFGPARQPEDLLTQEHKDLAASVQCITEELIFHLLEHLHRRTGLDKVCIAGGVAQNSVAIGKITRNTPFKEVYIPPAGHDAGISMGAALYVQHQILQEPRQEAIWSAYTGASFSNEEIEAFLRDRGIPYQRMPDDQLYAHVANQLINAGVVGWFSGRAEFGPRALGARSILADPRRADAQDLLNAKIKRREPFRPFAPSILEEYVHEYFDVDERAPFMERVLPIRPEKRAEIPAVSHVDGSGRLQSVIKSVAPRFYQLIDTFRQKTGCPLLLNTSFNENEPIVNSLTDALECYLRTRMDMLVLENCVIQRNL